MRIVIAGGHGQIARLLERRLAEHLAAPVLTTGTGVGRQVVVVRGDTLIEDLDL